MTWCSDCSDEPVIVSRSQAQSSINHIGKLEDHRFKACPACGHQIKQQERSGLHALPGLPAGVKFDPSDQELIEHLEAKSCLDASKLHPLIDEFIHTLQGENGICYTHPEKLPGISKDGTIRHFFHRPSKAYTTGTRKGERSMQTQTEAKQGGIRLGKRGLFMLITLLRDTKNISALRKLWKAKEAPKDKLGYAPIPSWK